MRRVWTRPLLQSDLPRVEGGVGFGSGPLWFSDVALHEEGRPQRRVRADSLPGETLARLAAPREALAILPGARPLLMGILNVTPDSFSDGGRHLSLPTAVMRARDMLREGADILDIGGESTRPGAAEVSAREEIDRVVPVIRALRDGGIGAPISIDTRKAEVLRAALEAGADLFNDVSALRFDPESASVAAEAGVPVCLMHAKGDPATMQDAPRYADVLLEVAEFLAERIEAAVAAGISRERIIVDPGIGFGKTVAHNLTLIRNLALLHDLGCPVLLGASRKRFIGAIGDAKDPGDRAAGSIAVALEGLRAGVQVLRVHDVRETKQAVDLWRALADHDPEVDSS
jgi:dihydropteroate synthase